MKKFLRLILVLGLILTAFALMGFTDLPDDHWASEAVQTLVDEGTVSGFGDGSFRPNDPVTRAQFVKMLGYRLKDARADFPVDLLRRHWAYDELMHSPLRLIDDLMWPDRPITREEVALYIYDCYADGEEGYAPSVITKDTDYPTEIGWVYDHGIMVGSDGIDLRLGEGLTRAEAAALIVKSRSAKTADFAENVSDASLRQVFNASALFDVDYDPNAVLTNGQMACAAYRLALDRVSGLWYDEDADFEHQYANDLKAMEPVLGTGRISADFADAPAMPEDALAMLGYGVISKVHSDVGVGESVYFDADPANSSVEVMLTFLWRYGVRPYGGGLIKSGQPVTHKMIAAVLLQCDMLWGLQTSVTVDGGTVTYNDEPMRFAGLPAQAVLFQSLPASVPLSVFEQPFFTADGQEFTPQLSPSVNYPFYNDLRNAFVGELNSLAASLGEKDVKARFTYYPQLVYDNGSGLTVRVRAELENADPAEVLSGYELYTDENGGAWISLKLSYTFMLE